MTPIEKIRAALEIADRKTDVFDEAKAALAELERAATEPVAEVRESITLVEGAYGAKGMQPYAFWLREPVVGAKLYTTPPPAQPAPKFEAVEVTDEVAERVQRHAFLNLPQTTNAAIGRQYIAAVSAELGQVLGMVEIREPTDDECTDIHQEWLNAHGIQGYGAVQNGRAMFDAVRHVMWSKA